jgi:hypothetical protein
VIRGWFQPWYASIQTTDESTHKKSYNRRLQEFLFNCTIYKDVPYDSIAFKCQYTGRHCHGTD